MDIFTEDGKKITEGDRLYNYYDNKWGIVAHIDSAGWFDLEQDDGTRAYLNGQRVASYDPNAAGNRGVV